MADAEDPLAAFMASLGDSKPKPLPPKPVPETDPLEAYMASLADGGGTGKAKRWKDKCKSKPIAPEEVDPLEAYMQGLGADTKPKRKPRPKPDRFDDDEDDFGAAAYEIAQANAQKQSKRGRKNTGRNMLNTGQVDDDDYDSDKEVYAAAKRAKETEMLDSNGMRLDKRAKRELVSLPPVDHLAIDYVRITKALYKEHADTAAMRPADVLRLREQLELSVDGAAPIPHPVATFAQMNLSPVIVKVLEKLQFSSPTPVQAQGIPVALSGRDIVGIAKTGSGKTLAFVLPMLMHVKAQPLLGKKEGPVALVLAPTRELAQQILKETKRFNKTTKKLRMVACVGGSNMHEQWKALKGGCHVVVATPGRLLDLMKQKACSLERVSFLALDEADRMFSMGFEWQIRSVMAQIRPDRQTLLFSATFQKRVQRLARDTIDRPVDIVVGHVGRVSQNIKQIITVVKNGNDKWVWLFSNLESILNQGTVLVFVKTKVGSQALAQQLSQAGHKARFIHGDMAQHERMEVLAGFKTVPPTFSVLVATDVAARGIDIKDLQTVINYDAARDMDSHVHRVGRTGRAGQAGVAHTLLTPKDARFAGSLARSFRQDGVPVPEGLYVLASRDSNFRSMDASGRGRGMGGPARSGGGPGGMGRGRGRGATTHAHSIPPPPSLYHNVPPPPVSAYPTEYHRSPTAPPAGVDYAAAIKKAREAAMRITSLLPASSSSTSSPSSSSSPSSASTPAAPFVNPGRAAMMGLAPPAALPPPLGPPPGPPPGQTPVNAEGHDYTRQNPSAYQGYNTAPTPPSSSASVLNPPSNSKKRRGNAGGGGGRESLKVTTMRQNFMGSFVKSSETMGQGAGFTKTPAQPQTRTQKRTKKSRWG